MVGSYMSYPYRNRHIAKKVHHTHGYLDMFLSCMKKAINLDNAKLRHYVCRKDTLGESIVFLYITECIRGRA